MVIDAPRFWEQVRLGEDSRLELKEVRFQDDRVSAPHRDGLADGFAAFANSRGGRVVLGVTDDRKPQALTPAQLDLLAKRVTEICSDSIEPPLDFSVYRVPSPSSTGGVLLVELPAGETVHRSPGGYFGRRGDSKRQMQPDEIRRLLQSRGQSDAAATDSQVVHNTGINSLSPELWRRYASSRTNDPEERTDAFGHADFELHTRLPMTVLCAGPGFMAWVAGDQEPNGALDVRMSPTPNGGSLIIANRSGHLPGIQGRLNPKLDTLDRTYLYADNIAINDGLPQPVHFNLNEPVRLTDSMGASATLWFREMLGSSCIFDYRYDR